MTLVAVFEVDVTMYRFIQKSLDWGVKIASLAVTGPATWVVATELFADIESPILLFAMRFAAVFLVEGVLLSNWLLLEFDKSATPEIKVRYGVTALTMYVALLVIGWRHEGPTGIVFRVALLAALIGSGWDTYVYTWQRMSASVDRSPENSGKVRRHARNLAIKEAIFRRESEHRSALAIIDAEGNANMEHAGLYAQRLVAKIHLEDKAERLDIIDENDRLDTQANGKKKRLQQLSPQGMGAGGQRALSSNVAPRLDTPPLRQSILGALAQDPSYSMVNLSEKLGLPVDEVTSEVDGLVEDGLLSHDGRTYLIHSNTEFRGNGKRVKTRPARR